MTLKFCGNQSQTDLSVIIGGQQLSDEVSSIRHFQDGYVNRAVADDSWVVEISPDVYDDHTKSFLSRFTSIIYSHLKLQKKMNTWENCCNYPKIWTMHLYVQKLQTEWQTVKGLMTLEQSEQDLPVWPDVFA